MQSFRPINLSIAIEHYFSTSQTLQTALGPSKPGDLRMQAPSKDLGPIPPVEFRVQGCVWDSHLIHQSLHQYEPRWRCRLWRLWKKTRGSRLHGAAYSVWHPFGSSTVEFLGFNSLGHQKGADRAETGCKLTSWNQESTLTRGHLRTCRI